MITSLGVLGAVAALLAAPFLAAAPAPASLCAVSDERLAELSGLAVDATGVWAISDDGRRTEVYRLDLDDCAVLDTRTATIDPRDAEDLALGPDGALWVADIGDNDSERATVAVIVVPASGQAQLHRLAYPDGPHNAEALLVDDQGAPVIVTKDVGGPAGIYRTDGPPRGEGPTPLVRVGELRLPRSDTVGGPLGGLGSRVVTGAAVSADRRVVAVRTYTDAWLYPATGGDVVAALVSPVTVPVRVPLPGEPQGEAITFLADGTLLSGGETRDGEPGELRVVRGASGESTGAPDGAVPADVSAPGWLPAALGVAVVAGGLLVLTAALVMRRR